jgi:glycosyltransferase involved in cell wall biosynthesis
VFTIGYFDDSAGPGGTTQYLVELLSALDRARFRPVVFSPRPVPWHDAMRALGAEIVTGPVLQVVPRPPASVTGAETLPPIRPVPAPTPGVFSRGRRALAWQLGHSRDLNALEALFRRQRVDLLHTNNVGEEPAPIAARRAGVSRLIGTLHVDPNYDLLGERNAPRFRTLRRRSLESLDVAIAVSARTANEWQSHLGLRPTDPPRFTVVPNGIRLDRLTRRRSVVEAKASLGISADDLVIGSLGRLDYAKGYADLIAALPSVLEAVPSARFVHAGRGPLAEALAAEAERLGIAGRITWLGFRSDVRDLLEATDVYVQPSWCEAHTLSVLEAGAMGLAVVASDVGGHAETLVDDSGWIVPARAPTPLAAVLRDVLQHGAERARRGLRLQHRVHDLYTHARMVADTMTQYDLLLDGSTR